MTACSAMAASWKWDCFTEADWHLLTQILQAFPIYTFKASSIALPGGQLQRLS